MYAMNKPTLAKRAGCCVCDRRLQSGLDRRMGVSDRSLCPVGRVRWADHVSWYSGEKSEVIDQRFA